MKINKNYFSYLLKSKLNAWIGLAIIITAFCTSTYFYSSQKGYLTFKTSLNLAGISILILTYILPIFLFSFTHRKRSCDQTYALPIKRSELLITTILFMLFICIGIYICASIMSYIIASFSSKISILIYLKSLLHITFVTLVLLIVNSMFYLFANNIIDGIIMITAYTFIPLAILIALWTIGNKLLISGVFDPSQIAIYLSPVAMAYFNHWSICEEIYKDPYAFSLRETKFEWIYIFILFIFLIIAIIELKKHFIDRKVERAEQISNSTEAYPFIINFYLSCSLVYLAFATLKGFTSVTVILYIFLFMVYMIALVIYKRKIKFYMKNVVYFIVFAIITVGISRICFTTKAFGLAYKVSDTTKSTTVDYNVYDLSTDLTDVITSMECSDGECYYVEDGNTESVYITATFYINDKKRNDKNCEKALEILENYRKESIDFYFRSSTGYNISKSYSTFTIDNQTFSYDNDQFFTIDELKELNKLGKITIYKFTVDDGAESSYSLDDYIKEIQ